MQNDRDNKIKEFLDSRDIQGAVELFFNESEKTVNGGFQTEGELWDYKTKLPRVKNANKLEWAEFAKDILAFHNQKGGLIFFGVDDDSYRIEFIGEVADSKTINDKIRKYLGDDIWVEFHRVMIQHDQRYIGVCLVRPSGGVLRTFQRNGPEKKNGKCLFEQGGSAIRISDESITLSPKEAVQHEYQEARFTTKTQTYKVNEKGYRILQPEYQQFTYRKKLCDKVLEELDYERIAVVQLIGIGGVGKTALATWAALEAYSREKYDFIISITAKDRELTGLGIQASKPQLNTYETLLKEIIEVVGFGDYLEDDLNKDETIVKELLEGSNTLLYVDNLETVDDDRIIDFLENLPIGVKALVTSRKPSITRSMSPIYVEGMTSEEIMNYVPSLVLADSKLEYLNELDKDTILEIGECCDYIPLAIRWTLYNTRSKNEALISARSIKDGGNRGEELLEFSFRRIFDKLTIEQLSPLLVLSIFTAPQFLEILVAGTQMSPITLTDVLDELQRDAIIYNRFNDEQNAYTYTLLPLTRTFVYKELSKKPHGISEVAVRERIASFYNADEIQDKVQRSIIKSARQNAEGVKGILDLANRYYQESKYDEAANLYTEALSREQTNSEAAFQLAEIAKRNEQVSSALQYYERAVANYRKKDSIRAKYLREWAFVLRNSGEQNSNRSAIDKLEEVLSITKEDRLARFAIGKLYFDMNAFQKAIEHFEEISDHEDAETKQRVHPILLKCYQQMGEMLKASTLKQKSNFLA